MALTSWSSANYLSSATPAISSRPLLLAAWVYGTGSGSTRVALFVGDQDSEDNYRLIRRNTDNKIAAVERSTATAAATTTEAATVDAWEFIAGAFIGSNDRRSYIMTTDTATDTGGVTPSAPADTLVGTRRASGTWVWESTGAIAEVQAWDLTGFSGTDYQNLVDKLAAGENPITVSAETGQAWSGALAWYVPLTDTSDLNDQVGSNNLTMNGTLTDFASHPTVNSLAPDPAVIAREGADIAGQEQTDTTAHVRITSVDTTAGNTSVLWGHTSDLGTTTAAWEASATQVDASVTTNDLVAWTGRSANTNYYFAVVTTDASSNKTLSNVLTVKTAYAKPTGLTVDSNTSNSVTVSATDASSGAAAHQVFVRESANALSTLEFKGTIPAGDTLQFTVSDLTAGTQYSIEMVAWDGVEGSSARYSGLTAVTATPGSAQIFAHHYRMLAVA